MKKKNQKIKGDNNNQSQDQITNQYNIQGDEVQGDKVQGDKIMGDKIHVNIINKTLPNKPRKNSVTLNYDVHISEAQSKKIKDKIDEIVEPLENKTNAYKNIYSSLYKKFNVTSYKTIAKEQFDEALRFLDILNISYYRPKLRKTNSDAWRKQMYKSIHARVNNLKMNKDDLLSFAEKKLELKKPITSISELSDTRLKKLYEIIFSQEITQN
ncbi:MAG: ORF6C domain-containing protein [Bacteroidales bacterium]|jgi:hypothetical protein|nr:ORF6C domain-containing protein [Bacteroidales bacterium]